MGDRLAQVLLDSLRADRDVVTGETPLLSLIPGARFSIEGHPYAPLNQEYLVVGVDYQGLDERPFWQAEAPAPSEALGMAHGRFRAIPTALVSYRPPRRIREHFVSGAQTAITTGPAGEEIYTQKDGHVTAQFYWDRLGKNDDNSSCWMRSSQLPTGGSMLLPRMKWEVAIRYLEGDVDRPFVMARMYNVATPPPYKLPPRSQGQELDSDGHLARRRKLERDSYERRRGERRNVHERASKDMSVDVGNNTTESIGANLTRSVGSNHALSITNSFTGSVGGESDRIRTSGATRTSTSRPSWSIR